MHCFEGKVDISIWHRWIFHWEILFRQKVILVNLWLNFNNCIDVNLKYAVGIWIPNEIEIFLNECPSFFVTSLCCADISGIDCMISEMILLDWYSLFGNGMGRDRSTKGAFCVSFCWLLVIYAQVICNDAALSPSEIAPLGEKYCRWQLRSSLKCKNAEF